MALSWSLCLLDSTEQGGPLLILPLPCPSVSDSSDVYFSCRRLLPSPPSSSLLPIFFLLSFPPFPEQLTPFPAPQSFCSATVQILLCLGTLVGQRIMGGEGVAWAGHLVLGLFNFMFSIRGQARSWHTSMGSAPTSCHAYLLTDGSSTPQ